MVQSCPDYWNTLARHNGWQRQAQLGDGGFPVRRTIAKACGLDAATHNPIVHTDNACARNSIDTGSASGHRVRGSLSTFEQRDSMDQANDIQTNAPPKPSGRALVAKVIIALLVAVTCFAVVMRLPESNEPFFDSPLRSVLAGVGLLGVAWPLLTAGSRLRKHAAGSPYFEEGFIAGVLTLFGFILLILALVCLALAAYALVTRFLAPSR